MASVHRRIGSPYWWGAFTLPGGKRAFRSTKCAKRADALKVCLAWEGAAQGRATESQIRRVFSDLHQAIHGRPMHSATVEDFAAKWLDGKKGETAKATFAAYRRAVDDFLDSLGDRRSRDLSSVTSSEVVVIRDSWGKSASPKTANNKLKALRVMFQAAWRDGIITENPASKVATLKTESNGRRPFTVLELKRVLATAEGEWRGMVLAGIYTGQRMGDIARLRWNQVDLVSREIALTTAKTGRRMILPIALPLFEWLVSAAGDDVDGPIFPRLAGKVERGGASPLSQEFYEILVSAGLATRRRGKNEPEGSGRRSRRAQSDLTFHSLRHTATSWLKSAGVSEAVARDIIGHDSAAVSRLYTHVDEDSKRRALDMLPRL